MNQREICEIARDEDLAASGIDRKVAKRLDITRTLNIEETELELGIKGAIAYEIPYFDVKGRRVDFARFKLISATDGDLGIKYYQEDKTIPRMYMPPIVDWSKIIDDTNRRLIITEGEKKAACACIHGMACIGLGGVWNWKSKKWGYEEVPDFKLFQWKNREVELCFDGDMTTNENVYRARSALTATLVKHGAKVFIRYLPKTQGKAALDDFLVTNGVEAYQELECTEADESKELTKLNGIVAYVDSLNAFVALETGYLMRGEAELRRKFGTVRMLNEKGNPTQATSVWVNWPHRMQVSSITYAPGQPRFYEGMYNTWNPSPTVARRGDVSQFVGLIQSLEHSKWFLQWLAYPIQHPGAKLFSAVVIWSVDQGTGKSFIGHVMRRIYGAENSAEILSSSLHNPRRSWIANKQFILVEEASDYAGRADYNAMKALITSPTIRIEPKYIDEYEVPNLANFFFASNNPNATKIDRGDRRYFVSRLDKEGERTTKFWKELTDWRDKNDGPAKFLWYLLNEVDCSKFDPEAAPPMTEAKGEMMFDSMTDIEQYCHELVADVESVAARVGIPIRAGQDVFTVAQVIGMMDEDMRKRAATSIAFVSRSLTRAGAVRPVGGVVNVKMPDGKWRASRLVAVRNLDFWKEKTREPAAWAANYEGKMTVKRKNR